MGLLRRCAAVVSTGALCVGLAGCGSGGPSGPGGRPETRLEAERLASLDRAVVALGPSYRYGLSSTCGDRQLLGGFRVRGRVQAVPPLGPARMAGLEAADVPTLSDLVDKVRDAPPRADVRLTTGERGLPATVSIDALPDAMDDQECHRVMRVRNAQDENSR